MSEEESSLMSADSHHQHPKQEEQLTEKLQQINQNIIVENYDEQQLADNDEDEDEEEEEEEKEVNLIEPQLPKDEVQIKDENEVEMKDEVKVKIKDEVTVEEGEIKVKVEEDEEEEGPPPGWASLPPPPPPQPPPSQPERGQMVCGYCRSLLSYPLGSKHVQCSCCQTVNYVLEEQQVGQVKCGACQVLLMYPFGALSVRCCSCRSVIYIGDHNRRPPLSVQQSKACRPFSVPH